ncbi:unnamed protein product [Bemisia tabaci]|uniref:AAA+ ATPase domain-containing protein n=1 Tax=Bemisia tabaci TaxID=7038 RepID=A0A9P0F8S7_BEMTA|nr:unnamed protein product [Bemisia tabaci]
MKLNILFSCIFGIGPASFLARADWVDEQKKHAETNLDANNKPSWSQAEYHTPNDLFLEFSEIRNSRAFIDKTFFLHEWLTHRPKHWYVTAPPGFGKTALAKMAVQFLNASAEIVDGVEKFHDRHKTAVYELFQGTNIFEMKEFFDQHFQNYAVIYVDLAPLSNTTEAMYLKQDDFNTQDFHIYFRLVIKKMMSYYPSLLFHQSLTDIERERFREYLENGMETAVRPTLFWNCVSFLKEMLKKTLKKEVIVIIDSYDALCKPSMVGDLSKLQRPYIGSYIINFSKLLLQDRLATVLYLGTIDTRELMLLKPSDVGMQTALSITHTPFSTDERLAKYFGLSKQEVDDILSKHSMEEHLGVVNDLLNGHAVTGSSLTLFNTKYVLSYIEHRNASTIAFTMPSTTEILHHYRKIFSVELISNVVTPCVYKIKLR